MSLGHQTNSNMDHHKPLTPDCPPPPSGNPVLGKAIGLRRAGFCPLPIRPDGSKAPLLPAWDDFKKRLPRESELYPWFAGGQCGIAIVDANRPGDDFNRRADWRDVLGPGWKAVREHGDVIYLCRPGKDVGVSATVGYCRSERAGLKLYVLSTNAEPFEPDKSYSRFEALAAELKTRGITPPAAPTPRPVPTCPRCPPGTGFVLGPAEDRLGRRHVRASCRRCQRHLTFVRRDVADSSVGTEGVAS
jgi:hypothetical protein